MKIDNNECDHSFRTLVNIYKYVKGYILDSKTDGSIKYSYSFMYNNIVVKREAYVANDRLILTTRLFGRMSETVKRGVVVRLTYAELVFDAKQIQSNTTIRSTLTAKTTVSSNCIKERIAINRIVPNIMGDLIYNELYRLQNTAVRAAADGRGDLAFIITHAFIRKLSTNGLKR